MGLPPHAPGGIRRCALIALGIVAVVLLPGCSFFKGLLASGFERPTLSFVTAGLDEVTLGGATVNLLFRVDNPNGEGLSLAESDYALRIEDRQVVAGKPPAGIEIPAHGSAQVVLPAAVRFEDLASSVSALLRKKEAFYRAEGHIGVQTPLGVVALPFAQQGILSLPRVPSVSVGSPRLHDISALGATLDLPLLVENPNGFGLPLGEVAGALRIAGAEVGSFTARDVGKLAAGATTTVPIPVRVRFAGALSALRALEAGRATVAVAGTLASGGAKLPFSFEQDVDVSR